MSARRITGVFLNWSTSNKRRLIGLGITFFLLAILIPIPISAQNASANAIQQLENAYRSLEFEKVIQEGRKLLHKSGTLSPHQLAKIHEQMALSFFSLGQLDSSRSHFLSVLSVDPNWKLDPIYVSPKIIAFFEQLKRQRSSPSLIKPIPYIKYVVVRDLRVEAAWRSLILPGWGQWYKSQKKRAYILGGAVGISLVGTAIAAYLEQTAHQDYLNAREESIILQKYDRYNFWYKTRRTLTALTAITWTINVADAFLKPAGITSRVTVTPSLSQLRLSVHF